MNQQELEKLSNKEVKELWQKTMSEARKQQGFRQAEAQAQNDLGITNEEYYFDAFGNVIEGKKPAPKTAGHYIDSAGYVCELAPGQKPPEPGSGDNIRDWLRTVDIANDAEVRNALGEENLYFETELELGNNVIRLVGRLESEGWLVTERSEDRKVKDLKFRLPKSLSREEASSHAESYVKMKFGPVYPTLTTEQIRVCERLACSDRNAAFTYYLRARLPEDIADQMLALASEGNSLGIQELAATDAISAIAEDGVMSCFFWANPRAEEAFFDYVRVNDAGRTWTFALLDSLFARYSISAALESLQPQGPTAEDLDQLSDAEIESTLLAARKLRAGR